MQNNKNFIALGVVAVLVGGSLFYQDKQKERDCLTRIEYHAGGDVYEITYLSAEGPIAKYFKTHNEAMAYCKKVLFK